MSAPLAVLNPDEVDRGRVAGRAASRKRASREALAAFDQPVYFALGGLSNPHQYGELAHRLGNVFGDFTLEVFSERHHFDPPHRIEPERQATSLRGIWARAGETAAVR